MRKPTRIILLAALLASPIGIFSPVATPAGAQTTGYYDVPEATPAEAAADASTSAKKALGKVSAAKLAKSTQIIVVDTSGGAGTYSFQITVKSKGKTIVIAKGTRKIAGTSDSGTAKIKIVPTAAGKKFLKSKKGKTVSISVKSSFKPKGSSKTSTKKTSAKLKK